MGEPLKYKVFAWRHWPSKDSKRAPTCCLRSASVAMAAKSISTSSIRISAPPSSGACAERSVPSAYPRGLVPTFSCASRTDKRGRVAPSHLEAKVAEASDCTAKAGLLQTWLVANSATLQDQASELLAKVPHAHPQAEVRAALLGVFSRTPREPTDEQRSQNLNRTRGKHVGTETDTHGDSCSCRDCRQEFVPEHGFSLLPAAARADRNSFLDLLATVSTRRMSGA